MSEYDGVAKASNADSPFELENIYSESEMAGIIVRRTTSWCTPSDLRHRNRLSYLQPVSPLSPSLL